MGERVKLVFQWLLRKSESSIVEACSYLFIHATAYPAARAHACLSSLAAPILTYSTTPLLIFFFVSVPYAPGTLSGTRNKIVESCTEQKLVLVTI